MSQEQEQIIYSSKEEGDTTEYYYYIKKDKNGEYYMEAEVINYTEPAPGTQHVWEHSKMCLKIKPEEIEKIIELLEKGIEWFEEEYAERDWQDCDNF